MLAQTTTEVISCANSLFHIFMVALTLMTPHSELVLIRPVIRPSDAVEEAVTLIISGLHEIHPRMPVIIHYDLSPAPQHTLEAASRHRYLRPPTQRQYGISEMGSTYFHQRLHKPVHSNPVNRHGRPQSTLSRRLSMGREQHFLFGLTLIRLTLATTSARPRDISCCNS